MRDGTFKATTKAQLFGEYLSLASVPEGLEVWKQSEVSNKTPRYRQQSVVIWLFRLLAAERKTWRLA